MSSDPASAAGALGCRGASLRLRKREREGSALFLATEIPTVEERQAALAAVPFGPDVRDLAGVVRGALRNQAIDLIDVAAGPGHTRAALVALYEGLDVLLQATLDLAESVAGEAVLSRLPIRDPLGGGEPLEDEEGRRKLPGRIARFAIEDAAVRVATAGDHFANAHLRLAWEANAATTEEAAACRFDPSDHQPKLWQSVEDLRLGLEKLGRRSLGVFPAFVLNEPFRRYVESAEVQETRLLRNAIVHRDRPSYQEARAFGRATLWTQARFSLTFPPPDEVDHALPTFASRRATVGGAIDESLRYATAAWEHVVRWLRTLDVWIDRPAKDKVRISTRVPLSGRTPYPREHRDPAPFLRV